MKVAIAFGSNLGDRHHFITRAIELIEERVGHVECVSTIIETEPLLHPEHPTLNQQNFLNGALVAKTALAPLEVLNRLLAIEQELGRVRTVHWGPRQIDLDIIACDDLIIDEPRLKVPHPEMQKRDFVLKPLSEVWPEWKHPVLGKLWNAGIPAC